jgi:hypothetical protein
MCITVVYYPSMNTHKAYTANNNTGGLIRKATETTRLALCYVYCAYCIIYILFLYSSKNITTRVVTVADAAKSTRCIVPVAAAAAPCC